MIIASQIKSKNGNLKIFGAAKIKFNKFKY